ncbi:hypothetical protein BDV12DRAFT_209888 [Aspergillus spectabilis]
MGHASEGIRTADSKSKGAIIEYLIKEAPEFQRLCALRQKGWDNRAGDKYFKIQRRRADNADKKTARHFYNMMKSVANEMNQSTDVFWLKSSSLEEPEPHILDMCMAPGGFLSAALRLNPTAHALAFSLPQCKGGHGVLLPPSLKVTLKFLDITMLAADMGMVPASIPDAHPDANNFILSTQFAPAQSFNLVLCDGQVLRTHERASYRERREATRLTTAQLALALEHLKPGGSIILLLHKVEAIYSVRMLYTLDKFASVRLFKPKSAHATRSSFYMIATDVRADCEDATEAVKHWKSVWKAATFETDEVYYEVMSEEGTDVEGMLKEFGPRLVELGKEVWNTQADALERAPFVKNAAS